MSEINGETSEFPVSAGELHAAGSEHGSSISQVELGRAPKSPTSQQHLPVVGQILHRLHLAGAEILAAELRGRLRDRFRFVFLCLDGVGPLGESLAAEGFSVVDLHRRDGIDLTLGRRIRETVRRLGIQLLHAHQHTPFFYAAASRRFKGHPPILYTEHGRNYPDRRHRRQVLTNRFLLGRGDYVTAVGEFVKQTLINREGVNESRIEVVPDGIDPERFMADRNPRTRASIRAELGLTTDQPMILQVARFHLVKDHLTAIRAMAEVVEEIPSAMLVLVGEGEEQAHIDSLVHQLEIASNVRFLGVRNDVPQLMAAADVFLLSSLSDGISVALLEAMACQLPIAATEVGGSAEVVGNGKAGLLSPRGRPAPLAENLMLLLRDPLLRLRLGQEGRRRLVTRFSQDKMHERYAAIYQRMVGV